MDLSIMHCENMDYQSIYQMQKKLVELRKNELVCDTILLAQHEPVFTVGRHGKRDNILVSSEFLSQQNVVVYDVERGGDVTYHGPGQLVIYPIIDLRACKIDYKTYLWRIQEIAISLLWEQYLIRAHRESNEYMGVWVDNKKIMAIGIAIRSQITMHGFAINVSTDLNYFRWIIPCGLSDRGVTSIKKETGVEPIMEAVIHQVCQRFIKIFQYSECRYICSEDIMEE